MIRLILVDSKHPATHTAPSALGMPAFGWRFSDEEAAQLLTFVRNSWGNHAPVVSATDVAQVRATVKADAVPQD